MSETKTAVILAGGVGKRLRPLTEYRPKPLIPVAGRPCIDYVMRSLVKGGFDQHIITTGYLSDRLIKRVADGAQYNATIVYSFEAEPVGTAGAVKKVSSFLDSTFVVASGDVLADIDIGALFEYHRKKGAMATMALTKVSDPTNFGIGLAFPFITTQQFKINLTLFICKLQDGRPIANTKKALYRLANTVCKIKRLLNRISGTAYNLSTYSLSRRIIDTIFRKPAFSGGQWWRQRLKWSGERIGLWRYSCFCFFA